MIEANILRVWIIKCLLTKYDRLKIDIGGDTVIRSWSVFCLVFVLLLERWSNFDVKCFRIHTKLVRCHEQSENFRVGFCLLPWQRNNFVCIGKHLTSTFNHLSNSNTNTKQKTDHGLITVSPPISIFSRSYFVSRHFMIQTLKISASINVLHLLWQYYDYNNVIYFFFIFNS